MRWTTGWMVLAAGWGLMLAGTAPAYVDLAPTLGRIVRESQTITLAEVERFNSEAGAVRLKKVRDLKGATDPGPLRHRLVRAGESAIDRPILEWAEPGRRCVLFVSGKTAVVCVGEGWYQAGVGEDGWWRIGPSRPDLPLAYYGSVTRLAEAVPLLLAGKSAVVTALPHGAGREGASFDLALNRASLPGLVKVQRLRASLRMPDVAMGVGASPAYVVGPGRAGADDVPRLREALRAADPAVRAECASDLGSLGPEAADAAPDLAGLLGDPSPPVRLAAASALLRVRPGDMRAADVLAGGLAAADGSTRRQAARAVGRAGAAAALLSARLAALLKDPDPATRRAALQAVATLGPAAAGATRPVTDLLGQREVAADAADALGRMGPAARPSLSALARMLSADAAAERWAAARAMAQIGGADAAPVVRFIARALPGASEVDGYNMLIYLALLGPVARDALPAVRAAPVRNPVLRQATAWAIDPGADLPRLGPLGDAEFVQFVFEAFVHELGDHLRPAAAALARRIMAGDAGEVPGWGYKLLARYPEDSLAVLTPGLADPGRVRRERAAVALGYMGRPAAAAKPRVARALESAGDERERRLLQWCLRELE